MLLGISESGYSNDQIALDYLKHFNKYTKQRRRGVWRLFIFDGHGSHLTYEFITMCWDNKIWPYSLPPHTSHILQPLDVVVFQPYKYHHKKRVEIAVREGCDDFNRVEFLHCIKDMRKDAFKRSTIQSAFKKSGIWPLNASIVLDKLPTIDRPVTPLPSALQIPDPATPPTPVTALQVELFTRKHLQGVNQETGEYGVLLSRITKLSRAAVAIAAAKEKCEKDLKDITVTAKQRAKRQHKDGRHVQTGGTIYIADARLRTAAKDSIQKKKEERAAKRAAAKALKEAEAREASPPTSSNESNQEI